MNVKIRLKEGRRQQQILWLP